MRMRVLLFVCCLTAAAVLAGAAVNVRADCDPGYTGGSITITSGVLAGQTVVPAHPLVVLPAGALLQGTVSIHVVNNIAMGVFPVCGTTSWGDHATSGWTITNHLPPGAANYNVPINVTVPSAPGTYYLFFAAAWEIGCSNILSCTNWRNPGGDVWNDGYDVADWSDVQAQHAIDLGWVCSKWITSGSLVEAYVPAAAVRIEVLAGDCDPVYTGGFVTITSGVLAGQTLVPANPLVVLPDETRLQGTVNIHVVNNGDPGNVFPVCGTTSWGNHATSGWTINYWQAPGAADYAVPIDVTVPSVPGTYYLFFAAAWEMGCSNVLSCTNWANPGGDMWNDGYDVADWSDAQAENAIALGWVCSKWTVANTLIDVSLPAAAVRLRIFSPTAVKPSSWGAIKDLFR